MIRQRLLGFLMLLALVVVFWPIVFEPPSSRPVLVLPDYSMPPKPEVDLSLGIVSSQPISIADPRLPNREEGLKSEVNVAIDPAGLDLSLAPPQASDGPDREPSSMTSAEFDDQGMPIGWELELVQFSSEGQANQFVELLQTAEYKAYSMPVTRGDKSFYSVRIGPKLQRERLIDIKLRLDDFFGIDSSLQRFEP